MPDARQKAYLSAMGIELWEQREPAEPRGMPASGPPPDQLPLEQVAPAVDSAPLATTSPTDASVLDWDGLQLAVSNCRACNLCDTRSQTVFGVGDQQARLMIIGEAPGADEDRVGEPFVGRAGQLLTAMLEAIGLTREQVYITNVLKCRPPGNRDPHVEEIATCQAYLNRQITLLEPELILAVGGVSAKHLLHTDEAVGRLRGRIHRHGPTGASLRVTYHPAFLLRRPEQKAKAWADLQQVWRDLHAGSAS